MGQSLLDEKRYPVKADVLIEKIEGSYLIMLKDNGDFGVYLNELSVEIFDMCDGKHSVEDIINQIVNDYVVTYKECSKDVKDCLTDLLNSNIITIEGEIDKVLCCMMR